MSYYVPAMQQRFTQYDSGQNTARNLLDAVRIKNQTEQFNRDFKIRKSAQESLNRIAEAQEKRTQSEFDRLSLDRMGRSDTLRKQAISEKKIETLGKNVNEALNNPSVNVKTIQPDDSIGTRVSNMFNKQVYNLYNALYPSYARDRYSRNLGLNQAVEDRSNINFSSDPRINYTQDLYELDRSTPDNLLNQVMINSNY
jgi:hypothetical protein